MTIAYQEFHGIQLAQGAEFKNLVAERLAVDPSPVEVGRSWFNTTDKQFKFSTVDSTGALIVRSFATAEDMAVEVAARIAAVSAETTRAMGVEAGLSSDLTSEATRAAGVEAGLRTDLTSEAARAAGIEAGLRADLTTEISDRQADIAVVTAAVAAEAVLARAAESALNVRVDNVIANIDPVALDSLSELLTAFQASDSDLTASIAALSTAASSANATESAARTAADLALQVNIDTEASTRAAAIVSAQAALASEVSARGVAEAALQSAITDEVSARTSAVTALDGRVSTVEGQVNGKIGDLVDLTTTVKTNIVAAIDEVVALVSTEVATREAAMTAEVSARSAADVAIRSDFNARRKTFTSGSAVLEHTFSHGFNSNEIGVTLWVKRDDGKYYNDTAAVQQLDVNTLKVYFTSARNIKLVVEDFSAI